MPANEYVYDIENLQALLAPENFARHSWKSSMVKNEVYQSGLIVNNPELDALVAGGGMTLNLPAWVRPRGTAQMLNRTTIIETQTFQAVNTVAPMLWRANGFDIGDVLRGMAGSDPMEKIAEVVGQYWMENVQEILIATLKGIFAAPSMQDLVLDYTGKNISQKAVIRAKSRLGDAHKQLKIMIFHSAVREQLELQNIIPATVPSESKNFAPGYILIEDDGMPIDENGNTLVLISKPGAIGWGKGVPVSHVSDAIARVENKSLDQHFSRRAFAVGVTDISWAGKPTVGNDTPTNDDLMVGTNWERTNEIKNIGMVALRVTVPLGDEE